MHYATKAGHINIVKLFVKSSADPQAETKEGKVHFGPKFAPIFLYSSGLAKSQFSNRF